MLAEAIRTKRCTGPCGRVLSWEHFHAARKWPDGTMRGPQARCKECHRQAAAESAKTPQAVERRRERDRRRHAAMLADPERAEEKRAYWRLYQRDRNRARGIENRPYLWLENRCAPREHVDPGPVMAAVRASGVPLAEIAARIGRDREQLSRWLHGERMPAPVAALVLDAIGLAPVDVGL